jgi:Protein of unknown function (DUF3313)
MNRQWIVLSLAGVLAACGEMGAPQPGQLIGGGTKQIAGAQAVDGFLPKPELLAPGGGGQSDQVYIKPGGFLGYTQVMLDPVVIVYGSSSELNTVAPEQREALVNSYYSDLFKAISEHCAVAHQAGPGVMRLHFALTDATSSNAAVKTVATYAPYVSTAYSAASVLFNKGVGYFAGTASSEAYGTDAATGELLWQAVDSRGGTNSLVTNTLNNWLDVDKAFSAWSEQLTTKLKAEGVCKM